MSTLYIRLPSKIAADALQPGMPLYCEFAVAQSGAIEREGVAALSELSDHVGRARRVVLLMAASDVTLLRVKVPPLSAAKLRTALPNLVEDQLMSDPAECVVVAGTGGGEQRLVAVVQRDWLGLLSRTMLALGARSISAVPSQLCLPYQPDVVQAVISEHGEDNDLAVRLGEQEGLGLSIVGEQRESAAFEVIQTLAAIVPAASVMLFVPPQRVRDYRESLHLVPALEQRITLEADSWARWIAGADKAPVDLMSGLGMAATPKFDWRPWRWPIALAAAVLLVNAVALNVDWLRMRRESDSLRNAMMQNYKSAFPKETVIVDPLAQLRQKMSAAQRESGQLAPDDFVALSAALGDAWSSAAPGRPAIASLEYRDGALLVKPKPDNTVSIDQVRNALAARNLTITQPNAGVWQIRSGK